MRDLTIYSLGSPPSFTLTPADDGYWQERLSCEVSTMLYQASVGAFKVQQTEESDIDDVGTALDDWAEDFSAWLSSALHEQQEGSRAIIAVAPLLGGAVATLKGVLMNPQFWGWLAVKVVDIAVEIFRSKANQAQEVDFSDVVDVLKTAFLNESEESYFAEGINLTELTSLLENALTRENPENPEERISLLREIDTLKTIIEGWYMRISNLETGEDIAEISFGAQIETP